MRRERPTLFKRRHFEAEIIVLCVRWYLRYPLSFRQLEEIMAERNLSAYSGRRRTAFRDDGERHSGMIPITIPG